MTILTTPPPSRFDAAPYFFDPHSKVRFETHTPCACPDRWERYLAGAVATYRAYGVEEALEIDAIQNGSSTSLFVVGISLTQEIVAGVRFQVRSSTRGRPTCRWNSPVPRARNKFGRRSPNGSQRGSSSSRVDGWKSITPATGRSATRSPEASSMQCDGWTYAMVAVLRRCTRLGDGRAAAGRSCET